MTNLHRMKPASHWKGHIDVAIITVKAEEFDAVLDRFSERETADGNRHYDVATLQALDGSRYSVAMTRTLEQGQSEAQAVTEELIEDLGPRHIFLVGIAGGVPNPDYSLGDVVLASRVIAFLLSAVGPDGTTSYQITGGTMSKEVKSKLAHLPAWKATRLKGWNSAESIRCERPRVKHPRSSSDKRLYGSDKWRKEVIDSLARNHPANGREPKFLVGPAATSDQLVKNDELVQIWQQSARQLAEIDMELQGVWTAAERRGIPVFSIRGVSDIIGFRREPEWTSYSSHTAAAFAFHLIRAGVLRSIEPGPPSTTSTMPSNKAPCSEPATAGKSIPRDKVISPATSVGPPKVARGPEQPPEEITSPTSGIVLVRIGPGEFYMGSVHDDRMALQHEEPRHHVRITKPFCLGKNVVTRDQFREFVAETNHKADHNWRDPGFRQMGDHPVVNVSWKSAVAFCNWLSKKDGATYRLPTEAEWEYACRAGSTTRYYFGDDPAGLQYFTWFNGNADKSTHPVGEKPANAFGLHDMHGNVWEWCSDWYAHDYYQRSPADDPQGPSDNDETKAIFATYGSQSIDYIGWRFRDQKKKVSERVVRGGGWDDTSILCRSATRHAVAPHAAICRLGFRVARDQP